jgi:phosphate transport system protein
MSIKSRAIVSASVDALVHRNTKLARVLIDADRDVDRLELAIDQLCMQIFARWQPVAKDLRTVALCTKMVTDLERIADLGTHIAEEVLALEAEAPAEIDPALPALADWVERQVHAAMTAFTDNDAEAARRVAAQCAQTQTRVAEIVRTLLGARRQDASDLMRIRRLYAVATHLEHVGNHAHNLAELVVFMVEGKDMRATVR